MWNIPIVLTFILAFSEGHVMFTNLKCEIIDKMFGKFETCHIKAINRTHKYMDVYVKLNKLPITNIKIIIDPMRNDNGYRPFFMSMTVDFCKYMRNPSLQKMTLVNELYSNIRNVSNLNHTCPYNLRDHFTFRYDTIAVITSVIVLAV
ncbi:uncharacterized protein LOC108145339 [Drosophila elegans]|uniref:uncharacterized protein LOC108145339 n=1 Tax=Drosophila elegans TaxID=30023 RepID=UPI0007E6C83A|nr:uncharacterized protein LOC108145339 [Drosophila elegans]